MKDENIIEVSDLSFSYHSKKPVLQDLSLTVGQGDFLGIIGPNGSGKSTFLKLLNGILTPTKGSIYYRQRLLSSYSQLEIARKIAYVPQDTGLDFQFRVKDFVLLGRNPYLNWWGSILREDWRISRRAMELTNTWSFRDSFMGELSGGERQRVYLARALAQEPELLLLDEPVSHLDINYQQEIFNLLRYLNLEGLTVVVVSHDLNLASQFCSHLALFAEGKVFRFGVPGEVLTPSSIFKVYGVRVKELNSGGDTPFILPEIEVDFPPEILERYGADVMQKERLKVHMISGGGSGKGLLNILHKAGFKLSVGVLNEGDADWEEARRLGVSMITEQPFSPISEAKQRELAEKVQNSDLLIITNLPFGYGNLANLEVAADYEGKFLLLEEEVIDRRDFTGGRAKALWEQLKNRPEVRVFADERSLLRYIFEEILGGERK